MSSIYEVSVVANKLVELVKQSNRSRKRAYDKVLGEVPESIKAACIAESKAHHKKADLLLAEAKGLARAMAVMISQLYEEE